MMRWPPPLAGYVHERRDIPAPSPAVDGQELIPVPRVTAAKLALYTAMRAQDRPPPERTKGSAPPLVVQSPRFRDPGQLVIADRGLLPPDG